MNGWEIDYSPEFNFIEDNIIPVSVIGEGNRGKSYLLGKITNHELPEGFNEKTEGISVKYLINQNNEQIKIALIDSAGGQTPIIKSEKNDEYFSNLYKNLKIKELKKKLEKNKETNEEDVKKMIEEIKNKKIDPEIIKNEDENAYNDCLKKLILDKSLTEQFIKDFVLSKSKIIILVVGQLTISEQLFINNLKNTIEEAREIIIIHNLLNFVKKKQVEDYINDVLKKSIFFNLEEIIATEIDENEDNENQKNFEINKTFYREQFISLESKKEITIRHAVFANDSKESEAGNYYNYSTINYVRNIIMAFQNPQKFDVVEELREYLIDYFFKYIDTDSINDISNKNNQKSNENNKIINLENLIIEGEVNQKENKLKKFMKLIGISNLNLKKITTDETGKFKYTGNAFVPTYNYYSDTVKKSFLDEKCKEDKDVDVFVIVIELAGKILNLRQNITLMKNGKYLISIWGMKKLPEITDNSYLYSDLDENEFRIEFEINMDEYDINPKLKKSSQKNGIIKLYYALKTKEKNVVKNIKIQEIKKKKKTNEKNNENNKNNEEIIEESQEEVINVQDNSKNDKKKKKEGEKKNENEKKKK